MTAFAKKNSIKTPIKHWVQKKFRSQNERNAKKSTFLTQKSTKTTAYSIKNRKRSKLRSAGELTVCASSRWSPRKTPKNGSEAKKRSLRHTMCQKAINIQLVINTSQNLNGNKERSSLSAHCKRPLHVPRLHRCLWSNRLTLFPKET